MISWPGHVPVADRPEVVSSIDLAPTILSAVGLDVPVEMPGVNLLPVATGEKPLDRERIFGESYAHDVANIDDPEETLLFRWVIEGQWKLLLTYDGEVNRYASTHPRTEKGPQLFNLKDDPTEQKNVASEHPELVAELAQSIADWYPVEKRKTQIKAK